MPIDTSSNSLHDAYYAELTRLGHSADSSQLAAVERLDELRANLCAAIRPRNFFRGLLARDNGHELQRGVYLWGGVGRGKTWLMDLFYSSLPFKDKQRSHFHRFMQAVHQELRKHRNRADPLEHVAEHLARRTRVLCFDELFVTDIADAMLLGNLFRGVFDRGVTLVATSNLPPDELYKDGLQRARFLPAIKLLKENMTVVNVDGGVDYRLRHLQHVQTWFATAEPRENAQMEQLFAVLSQNQWADDGHLELNQRKIKTKRRAAEAVWFEFRELCDGPRGQADYIELARCYHSVFVSGMPVLTAMTENQARRFISMVDEFYDRGVKLIVAAAAPIAGIYRGAQLAFEFERTRSRLTEMQSEQYLALPHRP